MKAYVLQDGGQRKANPEYAKIPDFRSESTSRNTLEGNGIFEKKTTKNKS